MLNRCRRASTFFWKDRKIRKNVKIIFLLLLFFCEAPNLFDRTANLTGGTMTHAIFADESMRSITEEGLTALPTTHDSNDYHG